MQTVINHPDLIEHGIQTESADIRCHVAPGTKLIFVFRTAPLRDLNLESYSTGWASQPGVEYKTGKGYLVPIADIPDMRVIRTLITPWWEAFSRDQLPQEKGNLAVDVVSRLLRVGRFPLWYDDARDSEDVGVQRGGTDIVLREKWIQVKCDYDAGPKADGGTGNIFLQTAEVNPFRRF